jgi:hypothetical protein
LIGAAVVVFLVASEFSFANIDAPAARPQATDTDRESLNKSELAEEVRRLRSQFDQKTIELEIERERYAKALNDLKTQQSAQKYELAASQARMLKIQNDDNNHRSVARRQAPSNRILADLARLNDPDATYQINAEGTLVLNNRYRITGRPIRSKNYDVDYWASCLIEVSIADTGEIINRLVFKKGVSQALMVGDASANLTLAVTPDLSSGCLLAAS